MIRYLVALVACIAFQGAALAAQPDSALDQLIRIAPGALQPAVIVPAPSGAQQRRVADNTVLVRFKKTTMISVGGIKVEAAVTDGNTLQLVQSLGLTVLSIDEKGLWRVVSPSLDAQAAAARLEADNIVLFATPARLAPAKDKRLVVQFRKSIVIDLGGIGAEVAVREDDIAEVLRSHHLAVLEQRGERGFVVMPTGTASEAAALLSSEKIVLVANPET